MDEAANLRCQSHATKVLCVCLDSMEEAQKYIDNQSDNSLYVEERKGANTRCEGNFCGVSEFVVNLGDIKWLKNKNLNQLLRSWLVWMKQI